MVFWEGNPRTSRRPLAPIMTCFSVIQDLRIERNKQDRLFLEEVTSSTESR
jgi:hypothetical protein